MERIVPYRVLETVWRVAAILKTEPVLVALRDTWGYGVTVSIIY